MNQDHISDDDLYDDDVEFYGSYDDYADQQWRLFYDPNLEEY